MSILVGIAIIVDLQVRPLIKTVAAEEAKIISTQAINHTVFDELTKQDSDYSNLVHIERGDDGKVLAITSDIQKMNKLKAAISMAIQDKISNNNIACSSVPLGTLINTDIFSGRGPRVPLKISLSGAVITNFKSNFTSAGINQTKHMIYLNVQTKIYVFIPGYPSYTCVNTDVLIAETVIVGAVPEVFANMDKPSDTSAVTGLAQLGK